jgi:hypothetical protein
MHLIEIRLEGPGFDLLSQETEYIIIDRLLIKFTISLFFCCVGVLLEQTKGAWIAVAGFE